MTKTSYVLKNISKMDVNLGDLRYRIPSGQSRDLLSPTARLDPKEIEASRTNGSIAARLGKSLIEVAKRVSITIPPKTMAKAGAIQFPQRVKSSIVLGTEVADEVDQLTIQEDAELLKEMESEDVMLESSGVPLVAKKEKE